MADIRINVTFRNNTKEPIACRKILGGNLNGIDISDFIDPFTEVKATATSNDRIFCLFVGTRSNTEYQVAMTCPKSSSNSAAGYGSSGLQSYKRGGTPANFLFELGSQDRADWDHGDEYDGDAPTFGDLS